MRASLGDMESGEGILIRQVIFEDDAPFLAAGSRRCVGAVYEKIAQHGGDIGSTTTYSKNSYDESDS